MRYFGRGLFTGGLLLLFYTVAIYQAAGKDQKTFFGLFLILFSNRIQSSLENYQATIRKTGMASQLSGCGSLGMEYIRHRFDT